MPSLTGKSCIVTGASSGIGLAVARRFAQDGANIALVGRSPSKLEAAARSMDSFPGRRVIVQADVTQEVETQRLVQQTLGEFGALDVLVNAAGAAYFLPIAETTLDQWDEVLDTNLKAVFLLCRLVTPPMLAAGHGDIVNIASIAAHQGFDGGTAYCASKHGLLGFSRALALEVRRQGLRVITVSPGSVDTPLWDPMKWSPDRAKMLHPEDVAEAVFGSLTFSGNASVDELIVMPRDGVL
ncbi:MAG: SDR family oxidoreductase [Chloroflexi bacterium]|nr:SDR family oxidoreductase [Chloroflexota bacterium]